MTYEGIIFTDGSGDTFAIEKASEGEFYLKSTITKEGDIVTLAFPQEVIRELRDWLTAKLEGNDGE